MVELVPYRATHAEELDEQEATAIYRTKGLQHFAALEIHSPGAVTAKLNGEVIGCGGFIEHWPGRAEGWLILPKDLEHKFLYVFKIIKRAIELSPHKRLEAVVDLDFINGHRLASALGFQPEAPEMRGYSIFGKSATLYSLVRE